MSRRALVRNYVVSILALTLIECSSNDNNSQNQPAPATDQGQSGPNLAPDLKAAEQRVTLEQITRKFYQDDYHVPVIDPVSDSISLGAQYPPMVDILIVMDNSGSMSDKQTNLSTKMEFLLSSVKTSDWQINVITTESPCPSQKFLPIKATPGQTEITAEQKNMFKAAIIVGTGGHWNEIGVQSTWYHLKPKAWTMSGYPPCPEQQPWIRKKLNPNATLAILYVTDENEWMDTPTVQRQKFVKDVIDVLVEKGYTPGKDAKAYGLISPPENDKGTYDPCRPDQSSVVQKDLILATKGIYGDVCEPDYSATLSKISKEISKMAESKIPLTQKPVPSTIQLLINDISVHRDDWYYDALSNAVYIKGAVKAGSNYQVIYKTSENRTVPLSGKPNVTTMKVTIDGKTVSPDAYSYKDETQELYFRSPLPDNAVVKVTYRDQTDLQIEFPFPNVGEKTITCTSDGEALKFQYFANDGIIAFNPPPSDGKKVDCRY